MWWSVTGLSHRGCDRERWTVCSDGDVNIERGANSFAVLIDHVMRAWNSWHRKGGIVVGTRWMMQVENWLRVLRPVLIPSCSTTSPFWLVLTVNWYLNGIPISSSGIFSILPRTPCAKIPFHSLAIEAIHWGSLIASAYDLGGEMFVLPTLRAWSVEAKFNPPTCMSFCSDA